MRIYTHWWREREREREREIAKIFQFYIVILNYKNNNQEAFMFMSIQLFQCIYKLNIYSSIY
jgi:hypothetical protein